ncbi:MAG: glycosyltransferase [Acidobacteriota bacterium]|nr:glycosyltransferase [Acidobacteriota bacterium]
MSAPKDIVLKGGQLFFVRVLVFLSLVFGLRYVEWRWFSSLNMSQWWISIALVAAETYSLVDGLLFGMAMWRSGYRKKPEPLNRPATVDVMITTYNEPIDLVMKTARTAKAITYPHTTYLLDDGKREELRELALAEGFGYITRGEEWVNRPLHAKAGNLNNALMVTSGEFLLILDADQLPEPNILDETLGYFNDPKVALVQTPQIFWNVKEKDVLGSQAPLFYGPIMRGKDGWNAAFFCGSNAILRREALMQLALTGYVQDVATVLKETLRDSKKVVKQARKQAAGSPSLAAALQEISAAARDARRAVRRGTSLAEVTYEFQRRVRAASRGTIHDDLVQMRRDLESLGDVGAAASLALLEREDAIVSRLSELDASPLQALTSLKEMVDTFDVGRAHEGQPLMPLATISVTEDMATAMRIHALGWKSVYHDHLLAHGMAPEDLGSALQQRLRWAQGTLQVMLRENPLVKRGLSLAQRLMYFATMWNYLSGFANFVFVAAPVAYLVFNERPVHAYSTVFLLHLLPYIICNQGMFMLISWKRGQKNIPTWRGQQYSFALFPLWIRAAFTTVANVYFGRPLGFVVTPKTREETSTGQMLKLVWPQIATMGILLLSTIIGMVKLYLGIAPSIEGTWLNVVWVAIDVLWMSVVFRAASYRGFEAPAP